MDPKHRNLIYLAIFLFVILLAFGLQISKLGFYLDDWVILQALNQDGIEGVISYASGDSRPFVAWVWIVGHAFFGSQAIGWQLYALFFRALTAVSAWLILNKFFPVHTLRSTIIALLFFVYPIFKQQSASLAFAFQWISFAFFLLSIYFQMLALERKRYFNAWLILALILNGIQLFTNEYFLAMELSRPLIIGLFLMQQKRLKRSDWRKFIYIHLPFVILLTAFLLWRFYFIRLPVEDRNAPVMLEAFLTTPVFAIRRWAEMFFQSMVEGLFGSWYHALDPQTILFKPLRSAASWIVLLFAAAVLVPFLLFFGRNEPDHQGNLGRPWYWYGIAVGMILMAFGFVPGWGIGRTIADAGGAYNDRFGLAAGLGASLLIVALIDGLLRSKRAKLILCGLLISIGIGYQYRIQTEYVESWNRQKDFSWQLIQRAPGIQPNTTIISNRVIAKYVGSWADVSAVNQLYDPTRQGETNAYWYYTTSDISLPYLKSIDYAIYERKKTIRFDGNLQESIVIMNPTTTQCLWVLDESDLVNPYVSGAMRTYIPFAKRERIIPSAANENFRKIWGSPPSENWCYYYQKARLAQEEQDWAEVINLYHAAQEKGFAPRVGVEYAPFIEAYAMEQQWEQAGLLTEIASKPIESPFYPMENYLCSIWERVQRMHGNQEEVSQIMQGLACE